MSTAHTPHVPQAHPTRGGLLPIEIAVGILLAIIGLVVVVAYMVSDVAAYAPLAIGLTCLALFALTREYGFAVPAGIVTGVGIGVALVGFVPNALPEEWVAPAILLTLAGGFVGSWLLGFMAVPATSHAWPFVPAAIIGAIGILLATGRPDAILYVQLAVAAVFIVAGVAVVVRYVRMTR